MASLNLVVEDVSPLIFYDPMDAWTDFPNDDSFLPNYSGMSLHTTSMEGATTTISFNIQASSRQLLATASSLPNGNHTAVITNTGPAVDIDYIDIECQVGSGPELITAVYDDSDSQFPTSLQSLIGESTTSPLS
ncbi:hypothetical protein DFS33DRAFT_79037 [Desarmillaria ectypa]|nr:hypothetical protein DFS33DRAFT_79037 [Desarmillaria ectypa]